MKEVIIFPKNAVDDMLMEASDKVILDKKTLITVPKDYLCYLFADEKLLVRIEPCVKNTLYKLVGKEILGKEIYALYILSKKDSSFLWGFGNINVNNERLKEAYRIGANGKMVIKVVDGISLHKNFGEKQFISSLDVKEKAMSAIKTVGIPLLSEYFVGTDISVFEISTKIDDLREKLFNALLKEKSITKLGIELVDITIDGLHVNEEDLALIRDRING